MKQIPLGRAGFTVSEWCLGTMTYGNQTPLDDAHRQIDMALDAGIDFIDTAEIYPVNPINADTVGNTERIIGEWVGKYGRRAEAKIATKAAGPNEHIRNGAGFTPGNIRGAVEKSLERLQTDYVDLYQLHVPMRGTYMFRRYWDYDPSQQDPAGNRQHMADILGVMKDMVAEGKIRAFGLSNESCWGTVRWMDTAADMGGPRVASVQNEYSLMCRIWDTDMAEMSVNEDVLLLAYSTLACGILTGKYQTGEVPENSRLSLAPDLGARWNDRAKAAADAYLAVAKKHGVDPVHMAVAWTRQRPFPVCPIIGATTAGQLEHLLSGHGTTLSDALLEDIKTAYHQHSMPF